MSGLEAQSIDIPLLGGINESVDDYLTQPGQSLLISNGQNTSEGGYPKRQGTTRVSAALSTGGTIADPIRMSTWRQRAVLIDDLNLYTLSAASGWGKAAGAVACAQLSHFGLGLGLQSTYKALDACYDATTQTMNVVWQGAASGGAAFDDVYHAVFDAKSGAIAWGPQRVTDGVRNYFSPRIISVGTIFVLVYTDSRGFVQVAAKTQALQDFGASVDCHGVTLTVAPFSVFDACAIQGTTDQIAVVYYQNATGAMSSIRVTITAGVPALSAQAAIVDATVFAIRGIGIRSISGERTWIGYGMVDGVGGGALHAAATNASTCATIFAGTVIGTVAPGWFFSRIGVERYSATQGYIVASASTGAATTVTRGAVVTSAGAVTVAPVVSRVLLASTPFLLGGVMYAWLATQPKNTATTAASFLLCAMPTPTAAGSLLVPRVVGGAPMRLVDASADSSLQSTRVPQAAPLNSTQVATMAPVVRELGALAVAPHMVIADWGDPARYHGTQFGDGHYHAPGQMYDGERIGELGYWQDAELGTVTTGAGGTLSAGTYGVKVVYRWIDARGRVTRSAPSAATSIVCAANDKLTVSAWCCILTDKQNDDLALDTAGLRYIGIEVYRTEANGTIYYLDQTGINIKTTAAETGYITLVLSQADTALTTGPLLLETNAPPRPPPAMRCLTTWQGRLVGLGPTGRDIWISNAPTDTEQPTWSEQFNVSVLDSGVLTALAVLDEKLVAFSSRRAWVIAGNPADINGNNGSLQAQLISSDTGCADERSVAVYSAGVLFRGADTFYLLDRGLTLQPIGLNVQDSAAAYPVVTSATVIDNMREIRLTCKATETASTGVCLVWHIAQSEWTIRDYYDAGIGAAGGAGMQSATAVNGVWYACIRSNGTVFQETMTDWTDSTHYVQSYIQTPWLKIAGVQGFQRCRRVQFLFRPRTACTMSVSLYADYEAAPFGTWSFTEAQVATGRLEIHIPRQKVEALRVRLTDTAPAVVGTGRGVEYVGLRLLVGIKKGVGKLLPVAQKG